MTDQTSPALFDDEMRDTLDMIGTVVASVSDRVDAQTGALDRLNKTATEARQAAFAAKAQTDPEFYGQIIGEVSVRLIEQSLSDLKRSVEDLRVQTHHAGVALKKVDDDKWEDMRRIVEREQRVVDFKAKLPWIALAAVVIALAMTLTLPRYIVKTSTGCALMGGIWTPAKSGDDACGFFDV